MQQHRAAVFEQRIRREHALFLVRALARGVILPVEEQIHDRQITQVAPAPGVEFLIQLLCHAAHRALLKRLVPNVSPYSALTAWVESPRTYIPRTSATRS